MTVDEHNLITPEVQKWLDILYEGVYVVNNEKTIVFWNKGAEKITGFTAGEMEGEQ